jgi:predicted MFS family arabinose efflux permease
VLSPVNAWLIANVGWRGGFAWLSLLPIAAAALILAAVRMPRETGAVALGQAGAAADLKNYGYTFSQALRTPTFWAIAISGFLTYYSILALFNHLFLHMRGLGFEPQVAARSLALLGLMAAISKLVIGWLADVIDRKKVFLACLAVMFAGVLMLATTGREYVWIAIFVIGSGWGGLFTLYNMLAVNNFGLREIGRINGAISTLESLGGGVGIWLTGKLFDVYGRNYEVAFDVIAGCVLAGFVIGLTIRSGSPEAMGQAAEPETAASR